jgi:putative transposase
MLLYRGIEVTDKTLREGCQNLGRQSAHQLRCQRPYLADKGHLAEVVVTIKKQQYYLVTSGGF